MIRFAFWVRKVLDYQTSNTRGVTIKFSNKNNISQMITLRKAKEVNYKISKETLVQVAISSCFLNHMNQIKGYQYRLSVGQGADSVDTASG